MKSALIIAFVILATSVNAQHLEKIWSTPKDLKTPESVLYSETHNIALVSCMGEVLDTASGDGYIAQINLLGEIVNPKWVTGLNDPKGLAIGNGKLYVADINELVIIDIETASIEKKILATNAIFLNDVTISSAGIVFVSDMKDQSIYTYMDGSFNLWLNHPLLENVNGLWAERGKLYAGNSSILEIDIESRTIEKMVKETGGVDGLEGFGNGNFIFSNWGGKIYYSEKGKVINLLDNSEQKLNTADIDFIPRKSIVLVPTFFGNNVDAYRLTSR